MKINISVYIALFIFAGIFVYNHFFFDPSAEEGVILTSLDDLQKQTMATLNEMTKLLISLATALFGLVGYFAQDNYKLKGRIEDKYQLDIVVAFCSAAISIDFGYIFMEKWVEILSTGTFQPFDNLISLPRNMQIIFFMIALFFSGRLIIRNLFTGVKKEL